MQFKKFFLVFLLSSLQNCGESNSPSPQGTEKTPPQSEPESDELDQANEENKELHVDKMDKEDSPQKEISPETALIGEHRSQNGHYYASISWLHGPVSDGSSRAELTLGNSKQAKPNQVIGLSVIPYMKSMGHGSGKLQPFITLKNLQDPHVFIIENIYFIMPGPWELRITVEVDGVKDFLELAFEVP